MPMLRNEKIYFDFCLLGLKKIQAMLFIIFPSLALHDLVIILTEIKVMVVDPRLSSNF